MMKPGEIPESPLKKRFFGNFEKLEKSISSRLFGVRKILCGDIRILLFEISSFPGSIEQTEPIGSIPPPSDPTDSKILVAL